MPQYVDTTDEFLLRCSVYQLDQVLWWYGGWKLCTKAWSFYWHFHACARHISDKGCYNKYFKKPLRDNIGKTKFLNYLQVHPNKQKLSLKDHCPLEGEIWGSYSSSQIISSLSYRSKMTARFVSPFEGNCMTTWNNDNHCTWLSDVELNNNQTFKFTEILSKMRFSGKYEIHNTCKRSLVHQK